MVDPRILCTQHLLGEHGELHKFLASWQKHVSITGRIACNSIEPLAYQARHDALAREMLARGYLHHSALVQPDFSYLPEVEQHATVKVGAALYLLITRCVQCRCRLFHLCRNAGDTTDVY